MDTSGFVSLIFTPDDADNNDYDLKIFQNTFNTDLAGIGTQSIGFVNLSGSNKIVSTASSSVIISDNISNIDAYFVSIEVKDPNTSETNFVELYATHDGTNTYLSEFFSDSEESDNSNLIGNFATGISTGAFILSYENDEPNEIVVRSSIIGIGTTAAGISTYRFKSTGQIDGTEKTVRFESNYVNVSAAATATAAENNHNPFSWSSMRKAIIATKPGSPPLATTLPQLRCPSLDSERPFCAFSSNLHFVALCAVPKNPRRMINQVQCPRAPTVIPNAAAA